MSNPTERLGRAVRRNDRLKVKIEMLPTLKRNIPLTEPMNDEQIEKLNNSLIEICEQFPFLASDVEVVKTNKTGKVVIRMSDNIDKEKVPEHLMQLEKAIQEKVEPTLRLYFEERKDDSTLRRL